MCTCIYICECVIVYCIYLWNVECCECVIVFICGTWNVVNVYLYLFKCVFRTRSGAILLLWCVRWILTGGVLAGKIRMLCMTR